MREISRPILERVRDRGILRSRSPKAPHRNTGRKTADRHRPANAISSCCELQVLTCCDAMRCISSSSGSQYELPCHLDIVGSPSGEQLPRLDNRTHEYIDLLTCIVKSEGRTARCQHPEALVQRHRTMGTGPHRYTGTLDDGGNIMRMRTSRIISPPPLKGDMDSRCSNLP